MSDSAQEPASAPAPPRPVILGAVHDHIPASMKADPRWIVWRLTLRDERWTKVPFRADTRKEASSTDHRTWGSFSSAWEAYCNGDFDGVGFVLGDGWAGVDIDKCIVAVGEHAGHISSEASAIIAELDSYAEISPSGLGVKVFVRGILPAGRRRIGAIELYDSGRYFTVTGRRIGNVAEPSERSEQLASIHARIFGPSSIAGGTVSRPTRAGVEGSDSDLLDLAFAATNASKFRCLWEGEYAAGGYSSRSEADLALCSMLAFWCGPDESRIDRMFRQSGLYRDKWNSDYYRNRTIALALANRTDFYKAEVPITPQPICGWKKASGSEEGGLSVAEGTATVGVSDTSATPAVHPDPVQSAIVARPAPVAGMPRFRYYSEVKMEKITWLWDQRLPAGKLVLLAGNPGVGKSFLTCDMAARVSSGRAWPCEAHGREPRDVIMLNAEDKPEDTVGPRLFAAGADLSRVVTVDAVTTVEKGREGERLFSIADDIASLAYVCRQCKNPGLVVIDPVTAYMGAVDGNSNVEVRAVLAQLSAFATEFNVTVLAVTHMNKRMDSQAIYRTIGSIAFTAAARTVHFVVKDQGDQKRRLFLPAKNNVGEDAGGLAYTIASTDEGAAALEWEPAAITMTLDEAMAPGDGGRPPEELKAAETFLREMLANGPKASADVDDAAKEHGLSKRTVKRARQAIGVKCFKANFGGGWMLRLAEDGSASHATNGLASDHGIPY